MKFEVKIPQQKFKKIRNNQCKIQIEKFFHQNENSMRKMKKLKKTKSSESKSEENYGKNEKRKN